MQIKLHPLDAEIEQNSARHAGQFRPVSLWPTIQRRTSCSSSSSKTWVACVWVVNAISSDWRMLYHLRLCLADWTLIANSALGRNLSSWQSFSSFGYLIRDRRNERNDDAWMKDHSRFVPTCLFWPIISFLMEMTSHRVVRVYFFGHSQRVVHNHCQITSLQELHNDSFVGKFPVEDYIDEKT